jgi:hypothetical protein
MKNILFPALLLIVVSSCSKGLFCLDGNGNVIIETRTATHIEEIVNTTSADVRYMKADTTGISIEAESNLIKHIVTSVENGRLEIRTDPRNACFSRGSRPVIIVTSPELNSLDVTGSGSAEADTLSGGFVRLRVTGSGDLFAGFVLADDLEISVTGSGDAEVDEALSQEADLTVTGSGDIVVAGSSENGVMRITGSGNIEAAGFILSAATATITASGNIHTHVLNSLTAVISGSGNIYLRGNPTVNQTLTGSGRVLNQ